MLSYLLFLLLYSNYLCLKLDLIDDYFVNVYLGDSKTKYKLLIDPTYPFTYILKPYISKTKKNSELMPLLFTNFFGDYSGEWIIDTFYFKEANFTIQMKFLDIYYKKSNTLIADGVLGLGSYIRHDSSVFYYINQTSHDCFNKISTYDRKNKKIIICDTEPSTKSNKFQINFSYNTFNEPGLITITKLDLIFNNTEKYLNDEAYIGLIPLLISPDEIDKWIEDSYFKNEGINNNSKKKDDIEIITEKLYYKMYFDEQEYPYIYDENRDMYPIKRFMDIYSFENKIISMGNKWYFGLDQNNIERVEFDFDEGKINIFVYSLKYIIIRITLFILVLGFFIYAFITVFQKRKDKIKQNEAEQELMDM